MGEPESDWKLPCLWWCRFHDSVVSGGLCHSSVYARSACALFPDSCCQLPAPQALSGGRKLRFGLYGGK